MTQYDKPGDPPSRDATMILTIQDPLAGPMIHRDFPGGFDSLEEYVMEVCEGIKDHLVRDPNDPHDTRWEYTYHQRLFGYQGPGFSPIDQVEGIVKQLAAAPHTRRAQAITWKVWEDGSCYDPPCLQSIWCRITPDDNQSVLSMNVRFRSNDAYKAAMMNIFALVQMQKNIAGRITLSGRTVRLGRYCHMADSYHITARIPRSSRPDSYALAAAASRIAPSATRTCDDGGSPARILQSPGHGQKWAVANLAVLRGFPVI